MVCNVVCLVKASKTSSSSFSFHHSPLFLRAPSSHTAIFPSIHHLPTFRGQSHPQLPLQSGTMNRSASPILELATVPSAHSSHPEPTTFPVPSTKTISEKGYPGVEIPKSQTSPCAKPFDRWRPIGGGSEHDIFRRFKILATEEEAFLIHWARTSSGKGILSHDETGALIFRISSASMSDLADMHIGRPDGSDSKMQWLHVYDQEGISCLTQSANTHREHV